MGLITCVTFWGGPADVPMILGQTAGRSVQVLKWAGILIAVVVVLIVVALILRKLLLGDDREDATPGFTLGDLRRLHQTGQLTDEEYAAAKQSMIARSTAMFDAKRGRPSAGLSEPRDTNQRPGQTEDTEDDHDETGLSDEASDNPSDPENPPPIPPGQ